MGHVAAAVVLVYAVIVAAVEMHDPIWPWWKTSLLLVSLCALAAGFLAVERWLL